MYHRFGIFVYWSINLKLFVMYLYTIWHIWSKNYCKMKKKTVFWDTLLQSYCIQMWPFWQLKTWHDQHGDRDRLCVRLVEIMTHLTIPGNLRNSNYAIDIEGLRLIVRGCFGQHSQFQRCLYFHFLCLRNHFLANRLRDLMFGEPVPRTPCPICRFTNSS